MNHHKVIYFVLLSLLSLSSIAFSLNTKNAATFRSRLVPINVSKSGCNNIGLNSNELLALTMKAANKYWNNVSDSSLKFIEGKTLNVSISEDSMKDIMDKTSPETVLVGCSKSSDMMPSSADMTSAFVSVDKNQNYLSSSNIMLNDRVDAFFSLLSESQKVAQSFTR
jgi:hypothetical protein